MVGTVIRMVRTTLVAAVALAAAAPSQAAAAVAAPRIAKARCVPAQKCVADAHQVAPGGHLALSGPGLLRGQLVLFQRGSGKTITSKLRASALGLIVTVPPVAKSGRIRVLDRFGRRSNVFGPIRVVKT